LTKRMKSYKVTGGVSRYMYVFFNQNHADASCFGV